MDLGSIFRNGAISYQVLYPMVAMVGLVYLIGGLAFWTRIKSVKNKEVSLGYFRVFKGEAPEFLTRSTRSFGNQFEMPTLFFVACTLGLVFKISSVFFLICAWAFVFFRSLHAYVHLTHNNVMNRMMFFMIANLFLLVMWVHLTLLPLLK